VHAHTHRSGEQLQERQQHASHPCVARVERFYAVCVLYGNTARVPTPIFIRHRYNALLLRPASSISRSGPLFLSYERVSSLVAGSCRPFQIYEGSHVSAPRFLDVRRTASPAGGMIYRSESVIRISTLDAVNERKTASRKYKHRITRIRNLRYLR
jgi:hypothetical protein